MCKIRVAFNLLVIVAVLLCPEEIPNQQSDYDYKDNIIPRIHIREKLGAFLIEHSESHERSDHDCQSNNTDFLLFVYFELLSIFSLFIFLIYLRFFYLRFCQLPIRKMWPAACLWAASLAEQAENKGNAEPSAGMLQIQYCYREQY